MQNVMASIDPNDLRALLVKSRDSALASSSGMDVKTAGQHQKEIMVPEMRPPLKSGPVPD